MAESILALKKRIAKLESSIRNEHKHAGIGNMPMRAKQAGIEGHLHDLQNHLNYPAAGNGGTLDDAYDFGGAGAGRTITVDSGAVLLQESTQADANSLLEIVRGLVTEFAVDLRISTDTSPRLRILADGTLFWGRGAGAAQDAKLSSPLANILEVASGDTLNVDTISETTSTHGVWIDKLLSLRNFLHWNQDAATIDATFNLTGWDGVSPWIEINDTGAGGGTLEEITSTVTSGAMIVVTATSDKTITLKHDAAAGNISCIGAADITLQNTTDHSTAEFAILFRHRSSRWIAMKGGGAAAGGSAHVIYEDAVALTARANLKFIDTDAVVATDSIPDTLITLQGYAFLTGRASAQTLTGGTAANASLTLRGTSSGTNTNSQVIILNSDLRMTSGRFIQDNTNADRMHFDSVEPHVYILGSLQIDGTTTSPSQALYIGAGTGTALGLGIYWPATTSAGSITGLAINAQTTFSGNNCVFIGLQSSPLMQLATATTGHTLRGLSFVASVATTAAVSVTWNEVTGCYAGATVQALGNSFVANVSTLNGLFVPFSLTVSGTGTINVTAMNGIFIQHWVAATAKTITTYKGIHLEAGQHTGVTNYYPLYISGVDSTTQGSIHHNSLQLGSTTRSFAGGDPVLGITDARTVPTADPNGGLVVFSETQSLKEQGRLAVKLPYQKGVDAETNTTAITAISETAFAPVFNFPANSVKAGDVYRLTMKGVFTTDAGNDALHVRIRWGGVAGTALWSSLNGSLLANLTNRYWELEVMIHVVTVGATGTFEVQGRFTYVNVSTGLTMQSRSDGNTATITVDTTAAKDLVGTAIWAATGNSITPRQWLLEQVYAGV